MTAMKSRNESFQSDFETYTEAEVHWQCRGYVWFHRIRLIYSVKEKMNLVPRSHTGRCRETFRFPLSLKGSCSCHMSSLFPSLQDFPAALKARNVRRLCHRRVWFNTNQFHSSETCREKNAVAALCLEFGSLFGVWLSV